MKTVNEDYLITRRTEKCYPISESEMAHLKHLAWFAFTIVGAPFLAIEVLLLVRRLKRETTFEPEADAFANGLDGDGAQ